MTTVFYKDGVMYSDGRISCDGSILTDEQPKVTKWGDWLIGVAGNAEFVLEVVNTKFKPKTLNDVRQKLRKLFSDNIEYDHKDGDDLCHIIAVNKKMPNKIYVSFDSPKMNFIKIDDHCCAIGSGSQGARLLMALDMPPQEILNLVSSVDLGTNNILYSVL